MDIVVWSKPDCPHCDQAKALLTSRGITFQERCIGQDWTREQLLEQVPSARSVPQIVINGRSIGGFEQLKAQLSAQDPQ